jgi:hypothetical protein
MLILFNVFFTETKGLTPVIQHGSEPISSFSHFRGLFFKIRMILNFYCGEYEDISLISLKEVDRHFSGSYCLHRQGDEQDHIYHKAVILLGSVPMSSFHTILEFLPGP